MRRTTTFLGLATSLLAGSVALALRQESLPPPQPSAEHAQVMRLVGTWTVTVKSGDQTEAERLPFAYTSYDPKGDVVVVAVGGRSSSYPVVLRHMVTHPSGVDIDLDAGAFRAVEQDGTTTLVSFFPPSGG